MTADPQTIKPQSGQPGTSTIIITDSGGLTGNTGMSVTVSPSGLSCSLSTTAFYLGASTLLGLSCEGAPGSYAVKITATVGQLSHFVTLFYTVSGTSSTADFIITPGSSTVSTDSGSQAISTITITPVQSFRGVVTLTLAYPTGISCTLDNTSIQSSGSTVLRCDTNSPGDYDVTITAQSGSTSHSESITIHVAPISKNQPSSPKTGLPTIVQLLSTMIMPNWKLFIMGTVAVWSLLLLTALGLVYRHNRRSRTT